MAQQIVQLGIADKGNGDPLRTAFNKVNQNFTELYNQIAASVVVDSTAPTNPSEGGLWWDPESGRMYVYYGTSWVDASPVDGVGISATNELVNGAYTVSLGTDGLVSVTGAIGWPLNENSPTLTDATINKVGDNLEIKTNLNLDPYTWSFSNLSKLTLPSGAVIDTYADGAENSTYFWGGNGQVIAVRGMNAENVYGGGIDIKPNGSVEIIAQDEYSATWTFTEDGNLSVPNRITFNDNSWQSTAFIGHAYSLKNNPNGSLYVTLDDSGTINTPLLLPKTFTAVLNPAHYVGEGTLVLEGDAWEYTVQFQVEQDGTVQTMFDNQPWPSNPGYIHGLEFEFLEADHGIPDYTFTLTLNSIQNPNPGVYTANPAVSPPPDYPATVKSLGAIKLSADEATWVFGTGGQLTVPGPIFRDGGLYMNSSGSTTAASVFVSGNSGGVILRTADNAQEISYDLIFDVNGETSFPGRLNFSDGSTLGDNILTGAIDSDLGLEIKRIITVSGVAAAGSTTGTLIVDISEDDDITVVLDGWEINAGSGIAPIWMAVTETTVDPGNTYEIVVPEFVFEPGNTYTFRNPVPESKTWFIRNQTSGLVAPGGAIITNETAPLGGGGTYRELAIELPTPDELSEQRWVFANDGDFTAPGDIFAGSFLGQSLEITDVGIVSSTYAGDLQTLHVAGAVGKGLSLAVDGGLISWLFKPDGSLTLPQYNQIESVGSNATISLNGVGTNESIIELSTRVDDEMITSTFEMHPAFGIGLTSVRNVDIHAGYDAATLKYNTWFEAEAVWTEVRDQDAQLIAPNTRPWAGMPSYEAYTEIMLYSTPPGVLPPPDNMAPTANTAKTAYLIWQAEQAAINVTITAKDKTWTFGNDGKLTFPAGNQIYEDQDRLTIDGTAGDGSVEINGTATILIGYNSTANVALGNPNGGNEVVITSEKFRLINTNIPTSSIGSAGDQPNMIASDNNYIYRCTGTYDGTTSIWKRVAFDATPW